MAITRTADLAPAPQFPERLSPTYETKFANNAVRRGPLRFEEGIATDTDVPNEFQKGIMQGYTTAPGSPNHNANVYEKHPDETMQERAHVGSAAWVEAPTYLNEFASEVAQDSTAVTNTYVRVDRSGGRYERINAAVVID